MDEILYNPSYFQKRIRELATPVGNSRKSKRTLELFASIRLAELPRDGRACVCRAQAGRAGVLHHRRTEDGPRLHGTI
jgi:hypothetical protein